MNIQFGLTLPGFHFYIGPFETRWGVVLQVGGWRRYWRA
jgi:hypothetical protein